MILAPGSGGHLLRRRFLRPYKGSILINTTVAPNVETRYVLLRFFASVARRFAQYAFIRFAIACLAAADPAREMEGFLLAPRLGLAHEGSVRLASE